MNLDVTCWIPWTRRYRRFLFLLFFSKFFIHILFRSLSPSFQMILVSVWVACERERSKEKQSLERKRESLEADREWETISVRRIQISDKLSDVLASVLNSTILWPKQSIGTVVGQLKKQKNYSLVWIITIIRNSWLVPEQSHPKVFKKQGAKSLHNYFIIDTIFYNYKHMK